MKIFEQKQDGEFLIDSKRANDNEFKKKHDVRYDKNTRQYYAKKKPSGSWF